MGQILENDVALRGVFYFLEGGEILDDNLVTQIISRLGVDYSQAILSTQQFAKETAEANLALQKLKTTASDLSTGMNASMKQADQSMTQIAGKTQAGKVMGEKIKQDMSKKLLETEVLLRKTLADAAKAGAYLPSGTERSLGYINSLQQQVAAGKQLTQQEAKAVESILKRTQLRQLEIKSTQQALALEKSRSSIVGHVADQEGRVGLAKTQNASLAKAELATLNKKLASMQSTVQTKQLENSLTTFGTQTIGAELSVRQAELSNLIEQLQINGQLNAQEMQRLNLLKGRVGLLSADVEASKAHATAQGKIAREQALAADQEMRANLAKTQNIALAKAELATLNKKLIAMQGTVQTKHLENNLTTFGAQTIGEELGVRQAELANLIQQLQVNGQLNAQEMQRLNLLKDRVGLLNADVSAGSAQVVAQEQIAREQAKQVKSAKDLNKEYGVLGSMAERRISWFLTGSFLFGGAAAMQEAVSTLTQVEADMTTIARITEDVTFNFKEMRDELQSFGVEYGMAWENVSDIAIRWSQAGYDVSETLELTEASLLALNTAELDANYACAA